MSHSNETPPERVKDVEKELRGPGNCDAPAAHLSTLAFWLHCLSTFTHLCVCCAGADARTWASTSADAHTCARARP